MADTIPAELRNQIYSYLYEEKCIYIFEKSKYGHDFTTRVSSGTYFGPRQSYKLQELLHETMVSRQYYAETRLLPFLQNTFRLETYNTLYYLVKMTTRPQREVVRAIKIGHIGHPGPHTQDVAKIVPCLEKKTGLRNVWTISQQDGTNEALDIMWCEECQLAHPVLKLA
ncbi:hypothetical protein NX059_003711 [Plenodomus lindquistii]|nr:hypothetical protein NX059_003711 [Plenodomus lindquistii]